MLEIIVFLFLALLYLFYASLHRDESLAKHAHNHILLLDYPLIQTKEARKFVLSIRPEFHSKLFPDSILNNEAPYDIIRDVSATNSIHKTYLCYMRGVQELKANDVV